MPKDMERISNKFKTTALMLLSVMIMACAGNGKKGQGSESKKIEYRIVETASGAVGGNELWATKDGEFRNTEIEAAEFLEIIDQRDYDGDGLEEAFVCQSTGGSGHLPEFIVYFDKDANVFRKVEFNNIGVFLNDSIEEWNGKWSFYGGDDAHYERFIFEKGRIVKVENYTKPQPEGAEALLTISPNTLFTPDEQEKSYETEMKKSLSYDLDGDGRNEIIECMFQHGINWGDPEMDYKPTMHISIRWSNGAMMDLTDEDYWLELKVLSTKTNGIYDLANGLRGVTYRWDGKQYKKQ